MTFLHSKPAHASARTKTFVRWFSNEITSNAAIYAAIFTFVIITFAIAAFRGDSFLPFLSVYAERGLRALALLGSTATVVICAKALLRNQQAPGLAIIASLIRVSSSAQFMRFVFALAVFSVFMAAFLYNKMKIPEIMPFRWDETFSRWDRILFADNHPWELLQPFLGWPLVTLFLDIAYSLWVPLVFLFWAGTLVSARVPRTVRLKYWSATVASWVLIGLVLATAFSSAGPFLFDEFVSGPSSPYAGLESYLESVSNVYPLSSQLAKESLWLTFTNQHDLPGGISAMPSMHNAQAALFAVTAYMIGRRFGHVMLVYLAVIFLGSVHLAWHYVVDGIFGIAAAMGIWWVIGAIVDTRIPQLRSMHDAK